MPGGSLTRLRATLGRLGEPLRWSAGRSQGVIGRPDTLPNGKTDRRPACDEVFVCLIQASRRVWCPTAEPAIPAPLARRVARLARFQGGVRITLPHPHPLPKGRSRSRPRFCTWGRQPPRPKSGRLAHLACFEACKSDKAVSRSLLVRWISLTSAWLGAAKAPLGRRSSRFAFRVRRGPICCRGVRRRVAT